MDGFKKWYTSITLFVIPAKTHYFLGKIKKQLHVLSYMRFSTGLLRSARNDVSIYVRGRIECGTSANQGRHCEEGRSPEGAIQCKQRMSTGHAAFFKSHYLSFRVLLFLLLGSITPLYGQGFDTLLNELSGSDADQMESEAGEPGREQDQPPQQPSSTDIVSPPEEDEFAPQKNIVTDGVTLQGLDKQTARVFIIDAAIGQPVEFGTLKITVHHCEKTPLDDRQESIAFVNITEEKPKSQPQQLYSGWMFASSPALSALDHPVYDVWIKGCKQMK